MSEARKERGMMKEITRKSSELVHNIMEAQRLYSEHEGQNAELHKQLLESQAAILLFIDALVSENATLKETQRWIPVEERLPELDEYVITYNQEDAHVQVYANFGESFGVGFYEDILAQALPVTHWMPLPEPPESEEA
jgi:hypothetical protein